MSQQWRQWTFKLLFHQFQLIISKSITCYCLIWFQCKMLLNTVTIRKWLENYWDWSYTLVHLQNLSQKSLYWVNVCLVLQSRSLVLWERIFEMDNTSLKQIVNRISLLKYRYMGSFPSDFVPNLPNDTVAIINTQTSNTPGEHWIMIAKFHHEMYFADSLGLSINKYPFWKQNYSQMVRTRLQEHLSVCGFYTIYAAFQLFKFQQEDITGVHDDKVFSFWGNFK